MGVVHEAEFLRLPGGANQFRAGLSPAVVQRLSRRTVIGVLSQLRPYMLP